MTPRTRSTSGNATALWMAIVFVLLLGVIAWAVVAFQAPEGAGPGAAAADGATFPDFALASLEGRAVARGDLGERVVLYDFWATWCGPCHLQAKILKGLYPEARAKGIEFVALATGEPEEVVRDFVADSPFPYPVLTDPAETLANQLKIFGLPTLFVVDAKGRILYRNTGVVDANTLRRVLTEAAG